VTGRPAWTGGLDWRIGHPSAVSVRLSEFIDQVQARHQPGAALIQGRGAAGHAQGQLEGSAISVSFS
jgi:hypothetical protein